MIRLRHPRVGAAAVMAAALSLSGAGMASQQTPLTIGEREAIIAALEAAPDHGLPAVDIPASDEALISALLDYARAQHGGRLDPQSVHRVWSLRPAPYDSAADFAAARADVALDRWLTGLPPADARYAALVEAYAAYRALPDWPVLSLEETLKPGAAGAEVSALARRLTAEGFVCGDSASADRFDEALNCAVKAYQAQRGLEPDGVVGPRTLAALNVPHAERLRQIQANLERWRWTPRVWPATRIEVDSGATQAVYFADGAPVLEMRAINGAPRTPTPMFASTVNAVTINPAWYVPASIVRNELNAKGAVYLSRNGYRRTEGGGLIQRPGPGNALGRIKFEIDNPFSVYLHDTPARDLFARAERHLSHGCVRLEKPRELAAILLEAEAWSAADIDAAIETGGTQSVDLLHPVPVYLLHRTALVRDGALILLDDVYGWDADLMEALGREAPPAPPAEITAAAYQPGGCVTARLN